MPNHQINKLPIRMNFETLSVEIDQAIARVTLSRPEVHNAFDEVMLAELLELFTGLAKNKEVRVVILTGAGKSFCAGADIKWMQKMVKYSYRENLADAMVLANAMNALYSLPQATIARVNGASIGGGMGLVTACDIAIASDTAKFSLSEVKIGLVPACIAPYVIRKVGVGKAREFFITGERLNADRALEAGFVNRVVPPDKLDETVEAIVQQLLSSGPNAIAMAKELLDKTPGLPWEEAKRYNAELIAKMRISAEGQEGCSAFLEKRKPNWAI
jgi:methylglutaconyl-CoA hydratase